MGSKIEKEKAVAAALERRGGICVLCAETAEDVEIPWHHLIMLFDCYAKPILDESGHVVFDRTASITTTVGQRRYSVYHVEAELAKFISLCAPCYLRRVHGHAPRRSGSPLHFGVGAPTDSRRAMSRTSSDGHPQSAKPGCDRPSLG